MEVGCEFLIYPDGKYCCVVSSVTINSPMLTKIKSFTGSHLEGKSDIDVVIVLFQSTVVEYFPRGLHKHFPNLKELRITNCGLKIITRRDLVGLANLTELSLSDNKLTSLPNNLFADMKSLTVISFFNNKLERLSSKLLDPIDKTKLIRIDLDGNTEINAWFNINSGGIFTIGRLMRVIDKECLKPFESEDSEIRMNEFSKGIEELFVSKRFSDFIITVENKEFLVHKMVLAAQSSVFNAMFETDMEERKTNHTKIDEFTAGAFEKFLCYIYTGRIPDETDAVEVFRIAVKYQVSHLKIVCEMIILDNIDELNASEILILGDLYDSDDMKQLAFAEIRETNPEILLADFLIDHPLYVQQIIEAKKNLTKAQQKLEKVLQNHPGES